MIGSGGNIGGGACSRSITDFATSAAERIVAKGFGARGFETRRLIFLAVVFGAALSGALGALRLTRADFVATGLRTAGISLSAAAGLGARVVAEAAAATAFRRACLAAFFSILNNLRACLSCAFAARTWTFAAAARAAALVAAILSRFMISDWVVI